jgi:hypothetical protein
MSTDTTNLDDISVWRRLRLRLDLMPDCDDFTWRLDRSDVESIIAYVRRNEAMDARLRRTVIERDHWREAFFRLEQRLFPGWWWFFFCGVAVSGAASEVWMKSAAIFVRYAAQVMP